MRKRPHRNRVTAQGEIVADTARGLFMGNRGILHDATGHIGNALWRHKAWIICTLVWKDWHRDIMQPGAYTELFFLDEAVAMAAGHRPCALCRRPAFNAYKTAADHVGSAHELDTQLQSERAIPRRFLQKRHTCPIESIPSGAIVLYENAPALVFEDALFPVSLSGYGKPYSKPTDGDILVLTPPTSMTALRAGYRPMLHPSLS